MARIQIVKKRIFTSMILIHLQCDKANIKIKGDFSWTMYNVWGFNIPHQSICTRFN